MPNASPSCQALGSRIDLERVQTLMAAVGSRLSPGARQLMDMVKLQQQVGVASPYTPTLAGMGKMWLHLPVFKNPGHRIELTILTPGFGKFTP